jgi:hypothetical protein
MHLKRMTGSVFLAVKLGWLLPVALLVAQAGAQSNTEEDAFATPVARERGASTPPPAAQQLLDDVVAQLPRDPLRVQGDITVRRRRGVVIRQLTFEMGLNWGAAEPAARYTIRDITGADLEQLTFVRKGAGAPMLEYAAGDPLAAAPVPALAAAIQGTDISWLDLSLAFLWWPGGQLAGSGDVKERPCYIVEVPAPRGAGAGNCAFVRLWIDQKLHMLLRAEGLDAERHMLKRLWVQSLKRINGRWLVKDLEVEGPDPVHRTRLTVREVRDEAASAP